MNEFAIGNSVVLRIQNLKNRALSLRKIGRIIRTLSDGRCVVRLDRQLDGLSTIWIPADALQLARIDAGKRP